MMDGDKHEAGFMLAEAVSALLVLSVLILSLASVAGLFARSFEASRHSAETAHAQLLAYQEAMRTFEGEIIQDGFVRDVSGRALMLSQPVAPGPSNCLYDVVGRVCR